MRFDQKNVGLLGVLVAVAGIIWILAVESNVTGVVIIMLGLILVATSQCSVKSPKAAKKKK
jgi:hypothetical protein